MRRRKPRETSLSPPKTIQKTKIATGVQNSPEVNEEKGAAKLPFQIANLKVSKCGGEA